MTLLSSCSHVLLIFTGQDSEVSGVQIKPGVTTATNSYPRNYFDNYFHWSKTKKSKQSSGGIIVTKCTIVYNENNINEILMKMK